MVAVDMPRLRGLTIRQEAYKRCAGPVLTGPGTSVATAMPAMLGKPDGAPPARRLPGAVDPNLLATGAEVAEASVP
eukprot:3766631-Lingulodinium_polyedra.AAC.1